MMGKQIQIGLTELPDGWNPESADFVNRLIQRKPENRLGNRSIQEIFGHPWFNGFQWEALKSKQMKAPFVPEHKDNYDKRYCEGNDKIGVDTQNRYEKIYNDTQYPYLFTNFTYYGKIIEYEHNIYNTLETSAYRPYQKKRCVSAGSNNINIIETISPTNNVNKIKLSNLQKNTFKISIAKRNSVHSSSTKSNKTNLLSSTKKSMSNNTTKHKKSKTNSISSNKQINFGNATTSSSSYNGTVSNNSNYLDFGTLKNKTKNLLNFHTNGNTINNKMNNLGGNCFHQKSISSQSLNVVNSSKIGKYLNLKNIVKTQCPNNKIFK